MVFAHKYKFLLWVIWGVIVFGFGLFFARSNYLFYILVCIFSLGITYPSSIRYKLEGNKLTKHFLGFEMFTVHLKDINKIIRKIIIDVDTPIQINIGRTDPGNYILESGDGTLYDLGTNHFWNSDKTYLVNYIEKQCNLNIVTVEKKKFFI